MAKFVGQDFATALCERWGLDPALVGEIVIYIGSGDVAHVTVRGMLDRDAAGELLEVTRDYKLTPE